MCACERGSRFGIWHFKRCIWLWTIELLLLKMRILLSNPWIGVCWRWVTTEWVQAWVQSVLKQCCCMQGYTVISVAQKDQLYLYFLWVQTHTHTHIKCVCILYIHANINRHTDRQQTFIKAHMNNIHRFWHTQLLTGCSQMLLIYPFKG